MVRLLPFRPTASPDWNCNPNRGVPMVTDALSAKEIAELKDTKLATSETSVITEQPKRKRTRKTVDKA